MQASYSEFEEYSLSPLYAPSLADENSPIRIAKQPIEEENEPDLSFPPKEKWAKYKEVFTNLPSEAVKYFRDLGKGEKEAEQQGNNLINEIFPDFSTFLDICEEMRFSNYPLIFFLLNLKGYTKEELLEMGSIFSEIYRLAESEKQIAQEF